MSANIDDILNPKPEPNTHEERVMAVLKTARERSQALTKREILQACQVDWFEVAKPGEGGVLLAIAMAAVAHETGIRKTFDKERAEALERLMAKGLVRSKEHQGQLHYWAEERKSLAS